MKVVLQTPTQLVVHEGALKTVVLGAGVHGGGDRVAAAVRRPPLRVRSRGGERARGRAAARPPDVRRIPAQRPAGHRARALSGRRSPDEPVLPDRLPDKAGRPRAVDPVQHRRRGYPRGVRLRGADFLWVGRSSNAERACRPAPAPARLRQRERPPRRHKLGVRRVIARDLRRHRAGAVRLGSVSRRHVAARRGAGSIDRHQGGAWQ